MMHARDASVTQAKDCHRLRVFLPYWGVKFLKILRLARIPKKLPLGSGRPWYCVFWSLNRAVFYATA